MFHHSDCRASYFGPSNRFIETLISAHWHLPRHSYIWFIVLSTKITCATNCELAGPKKSLRILIFNISINYLRIEFDFIISFGMNSKEILDIDFEWIVLCNMWLSFGRRPISIIIHSVFRSNGAHFIRMTVLDTRKKHWICVLKANYQIAIVKIWNKNVAIALIMSRYFWISISDMTKRRIHESWLNVNWKVGRRKKT